MFDLILPAADIVAIAVLALVLYYPRHHRHDLTLSYLAVNVGVLGVATALGTTSVNAGLGLGLFGVLAIIRLRSLELDQHEIAYYFTALALGVIGGLGADMGWAAVGLMALILVVIAIGDAGVFTRRQRSQVVVLDHAVTDDAELRARLEDLLGAKVVDARPRRVDLVNDTTVVDVRYVVGVGRPVGAAPVSPLEVRA
ncbi:MAG: DUF4956 domain-containing protein [Propionibacteriaceae bacterium]|jgi:hypothetical protein|nr:DUF4956 domain-containing protein [Propionibacteriaceae bacterium]